MATALPSVSLYLENPLEHHVESPSFFILLLVPFILSTPLVYYGLFDPPSLLEYGNPSSSGCGYLRDSIPES